MARTEQSILRLFTHSYTSWVDLDGVISVESRIAYYKNEHERTQVGIGGKTFQIYPAFQRLCGIRTTNSFSVSNLNQ